MKGLFRLLGMLCLALVVAAGAFAAQPGTTQAAGPAYGCAYTVRDGDDLFRLSLRYNVSPDAMMGYNGLYTPFLYTGMTLRVPCTGAFSPAYNAPSVNYQAPSYPMYGPYPAPGYRAYGPYPAPGYNAYGQYPAPGYSAYANNICSYAVVYPGQDLYRIALSYGMSWQVLAAANHLYNPNLIYAGTRLAIPCSAGAKPYTAPSNPYGGQTAPYATPAPTVTPGQSTSVTIQDFMFTPASLTIHVGQMVTWTNNGPSSHTTTSDNGLWNSGTLAPGSSFSHTFTSAGTFTYHCLIHPMMRGTIVVVP